jgi:hypothetical protein
MTAPFQARGTFVNPEVMAAAASYLSREWGEYGYTLCLVDIVSSSDVGVFECAHFDGSRWNIAADRYGNAIKLSGVGIVAVEELSELREKARTP